MTNLKPLALLGLGLVALSSCANQPQAEKSKAMIFTVADTGTTTTLFAGQSFEVKLLGTPTAGYSWEVQTLPAGVVLVDKKSEPENPKGRAQRMVGGNDWTSFRFKTSSAPADLQATTGQALVLRYARPWEFEAGKPADQIWQMQIVVKPGS
ncbi:protease inhibitor I42 family protein [Aquidulcibacter sp.]|jgi:predicted secreted protein|uniref:protease inhibitor I42 family protein n=1 Tax=Aquidulcibacter sp. TaxID=2052990 RepID=UPI0028A8C3E4|nr:protease inhibitor I42 family protein [Aquidulcibacter sp.]